MCVRVLYNLPSSRPVAYLSVAVLLVHVAALLEQQARDVRVAVRGGAAQQRRPERAAIGPVHVGAHLEQLAHRLQRLSVHRRVQRRAARCVASNARVESSDIRSHQLFSGQLINVIVEQ